MWQGTAYKEETRKIILSMERVRKVTLVGAMWEGLSSMRASCLLAWHSSRRHKRPCSGGCRPQHAARHMRVTGLACCRRSRSATARACCCAAPVSTLASTVHARVRTGPLPSKTLCSAATATAVAQIAPSGKELLKGVSLGMYLGAKIGILGANGAGAPGTALDCPSPRGRQNRNARPSFPLPVVPCCLAVCLSWLARPQVSPR